MTKEGYLDLMEQVVCAYSDEQIEDYIAQVESRGIWEHGFPRLGANIGILMAQGRLLRLKNYFVRIMDLCCEQIPLPTELRERRGNDFSVKEITVCLMELGKTDLFPRETVEKWKQGMAAVEPHACYRMIAPNPPVAVDNWAAFNAASEQVRCFAGIADTRDYIDNQVASQILSFEENGMYRDPNEPMVYDLVTRVQLSNVLFFGYQGPYRAALDALLEKAGKATLLMQSVTGELPFGGRSNQFLHNEAHIAALCEYEARRYWARGDTESAGAFRAAAELAVNSIKKWWLENPHHHIKNYYPIYSQMGCEKYAYYDKYMVTTASFLCNAWLFADETIPVGECPAQTSGSHTWQTSPWFHKLFCKQDDLFLELEWKADPHYDASGIGRIHRRGAPGPLCLSASVSQSPQYGTGEPNPCPMSICPGVWDGQWHFAWDRESRCRILAHSADERTARAQWQAEFRDGKTALQTVTLADHTVTLETKIPGKGGLLLPAFSFDGREETQMEQSDSALSVTYHGWRCTYATDGTLVDTGLVCTNRNGRYRLFRAEGVDTLLVKITMVPIGEIKGA